MEPAALAPLFAAVHRALDDNEAEYAEMPFFVRPIVRRGLVKRTGRDLAGWRATLTAAARGPIAADLVAGLAALAEHYRGAPARAQRGMGATPAQLAIVVARSQARAAAVTALHDALR